MVKYPAGLQLISLGRDRWLKWPTSKRVPGDVWMRYYQEADGRWSVGTVVIDTMPTSGADDGSRGPITGDVLKAVRVAEAERYLNEALGPQPAEVTANYVPKGWTHTDPVALLRDQPAVKASRERKQRSRGSRYRLTSMPPNGQLTDAYLQKVVKAYRAAVEHDLAPAPAIADDTGAAVRTVRSWIHKARQRGFMSPGRPGKLG